MVIKGTQETEVMRDEDGYVIIKQMKGTVTLSLPQMDAVLQWLREGNGLCAEADWNAGLVKAEA